MNIISQVNESKKKQPKGRQSSRRQRVDVYCTLPHLDRSESEHYIRSHLEYAGAVQDVFTDKAMDIIHSSSTGILRMINRICDKSLIYAFQKQKRLIDDHMVQYVLEHELLTTK